MPQSRGPGKGLGCLGSRGPGGPGSRGLGCPGSRVPGVLESRCLGCLGSRGQGSLGAEAWGVPGSRGPGVGPWQAWSVWPTPSALVCPVLPDAPGAVTLDVPMHCWAHGCHGASGPLHIRLAHTQLTRGTAHLPSDRDETAEAAWTRPGRGAAPGPRTSTHRHTDTAHRYTPHTGTATLTHLTHTHHTHHMTHATRTYSTDTTLTCTYTHHTDSPHPHHHHPTRTHPSKPRHAQLEQGGTLLRPEERRPRPMAR